MREITNCSGGALPASALAQSAAPTPWVLTPDMGYGYDKEGKTFAYKMGTNNAGALLKGAKKVPKGTLFFIGQNGQLYMRTGPYLGGGGTPPTPPLPQGERGKKPRCTKTPLPFPSRPADCCWNPSGYR